MRQCSAGVIISCCGGARAHGGAAVVLLLPYVHSAPDTGQYYTLAVKESNLKKI